MPDSLKLIWNTAVGGLIHEYGKNVGYSQYHICYSRIVCQRDPCCKVLCPLCDKKEVSSPDRRSILCSNDVSLSDTVFYVGCGGIYYRNHSGLLYIIAL